MALFGGVAGPFTTAWLLMGYENVCYWSFDHPNELMEIFKISNEYYIEAINRMVDIGMDAIMIAEDLGYRGGLFVSPENYRKYLFPYLHEIIDAVKKIGKPVIFHCDGQINEVLTDLVDMGIDALNPIERKAGMDIGEVKRKYGNKICLIGNLDLVNILPHGTIEEVDNHVKELIEGVGTGGGYIVASEHSLNHHIPIENILAIRDAVFKHGWYH